MPSGDGEAGNRAAPGHHRVEIVHESLLKAWPRLVRWQAQDEEGALLRDQLKQAAHLWEEKGRPADLLWSGTSFREYELWRERYPGELTALEEYVRARRWPSAPCGGGGCAAAAVAVAFLVRPERSVAIVACRASRPRRRVTRHERSPRAEASRLVTLAQLRLADDPTEALAFATASLEVATRPRPASSS